MDQVVNQIFFLLQGKKNYKYQKLSTMKNMISIIVFLFLPHRNECVKGVKKTTAVRITTGSFPKANSSLTGPPVKSPI